MEMSQLKEVCKIGQGNDTCRYVVIGADGFHCTKLTSIKSTIDKRVNKMTAKGDNCNGIEN